MICTLTVYDSSLYTIYKKYNGLTTNQLEQDKEVLLFTPTNVIVPADTQHSVNVCTKVAITLSDGLSGAIHPIAFTQNAASPFIPKAIAPSNDKKKMTTITITNLTISPVVLPAFSKCATLRLEQNAILEIIDKGV